MYHLFSVKVKNVFLNIFPVSKSHYCVHCVHLLQSVNFHIHIKEITCYELSGHLGCWWSPHSSRGFECLITYNFPGCSHSFCVGMKLNRHDVAMLYSEALGKIRLHNPIKANHFKNRFNFILYAKHNFISWLDSRRGNRWWMNKIGETPWITITAHSLLKLYSKLDYL